MGQFERQGFDAEFSVFKTKIPQMLADRVSQCTRGRFPSLAERCPALRQLAEQGGFLCGEFGQTVFT